MARMAGILTDPENDSDDCTTMTVSGAGVKANAEVEAVRAAVDKTKADKWSKAYTFAINAYYLSSDDAECYSDIVGLRLHRRTLKDQGGGTFGHSLFRSVAQSSYSGR